MLKMEMGVLHNLFASCGRSMQLLRGSGLPLFYPSSLPRARKMREMAESCAINRQVPGQRRPSAPGTTPSEVCCLQCPKFKRPHVRREVFVFWCTCAPIGYVSLLMVVDITNVHKCSRKKLFSNGTFFLQSVLPNSLLRFLLAIGLRLQNRLYFREFGSCPRTRAADHALPAFSVYSM